MAQGNDFSSVFELCGEAEDGFRAACYQGLGRDVAGQKIQDSINDAAIANSTGMLCALGQDVEARSNCVAGAINFLVYYYHDDAQARALCETFDESLRAVCSRAVEEYHASFET